VTTNAAMKHAYDYNLKGNEISVFFIGDTRKGMCNNVNELGRKCWFKSKLLNDVECLPGEHCLHFVSHDGFNRHNYTCPTWMTNMQGERCRLPNGWQACPEHFTLMREDSGILQEFLGMSRAQCPKENAEGKTVEELESASAAYRHPLETTKSRKAYEAQVSSSQYEISNMATAFVGSALYTGKSAEPFRCSPTTCEADIQGKVGASAVEASAHKANNQRAACLRVEVPPWIRRTPLLHVRPGSMQVFPFFSESLAGAKVMRRVGGLPRRSSSFL